MKFIRWKYVVPRLVVLIVVVMSVKHGLDPLLHYLIVSAGQSVTGAKVELAAVETSLRDGRIALRGLQVANPQSLMRNLAEAERTELLVDMNALLHKRLVVRSGEVTGLKFDTERSESGELEIVIDEGAGPSAFDPILAQASQWVAAWLDEAGNRLDSDFADQLQTPQVAEALEQRWKQQAESLRRRTEEMKACGKQLETEFRAVKSNPLRGIERLPALQTELKTVQQKLASLQIEIKNLPQQVKSDRNSLLEARKADEQFVREQLKIDRLDGDNLTQVLLGESVANNLQTACDWIAWARKRMPTHSSKEIARTRSRGTEVSFVSGLPKLYIQRLDLSLSAPVLGESSLFTGSLANISDKPESLAEPTRLDLIAEGEVPVTIQIVSDRRGGISRDELFLTCSAIPLDGCTFGNQEKLAMQLSPGTANVRVDLALDGEQLSGHISFKQPHLSITPVAGVRANPTLTTTLNRAFNGVDQLSAEIQLAGTLKRPQVRIESPLGRQLAEGVSNAVLNIAHEKSEVLLAKVSARMNEQFAQLESTKNELQQELLAKLGEEQQLFETLASFTGTDDRFSVPQLGSFGSGLLRK